MYKLTVILVVVLAASEAVSLDLRRQVVAVPELVTIDQTTPTTTDTTDVTIVFNSTDESDVTVSDFAMSIVIQQCITDCPKTTENQPICGSNGVVYANPGSLFCAQACGVDVTMRRFGSC